MDLLLRGLQQRKLDELLELSRSVRQFLEGVRGKLQRVY